MKKTENLERLSEEMHEYPPNYPKIIERFKSYASFDINNAFYLDRYSNYFSEIYLDICLEDIRKNLKLDILFDIPLSGRVSENYRFQYGSDDRYNLKNNLYAYPLNPPNPNDRNRNNEYDKLIILDNLPVVLEIKIGRWRQSGRHKKVKNKSRSGGSWLRKGIKQYLMQEFYDRKLDPIKEFFKSDVGYVMIIPKNYYYKQINSNSSLVNQFHNNNGIVVPFFTDRHSFRKEVEEIVIKNGLKLKT